MGETFAGSRWTGPAGGAWTVCEAGESAPLRCGLCGRLAERAWRYFVGATAYATVCCECADAASEEGEET